VKVAINLRPELNPHPCHPQRSTQHMTHPLSQAPLWTEHRGPTFTVYEYHVYWNNVNRDQSCTSENCRGSGGGDPQLLLRRRNGRKTAAAPVLVAWAWVRAASIGRMAPSAALYEAVTPPACYAASLGASTALQNRSRRPPTNGLSPLWQAALAGCGSSALLARRTGEVILCWGQPMPSDLCPRHLRGRGARFTCILALVWK
jgi:hypothetical protein